MNFGLRLLDHADCQIERIDPRTNLTEQGGVFARPAAKLQDGMVMSLAERIAGNDLIEIARQVAIRVVSA